LPVVAEIIDHPFNTTLLFVKHQGNNDAGVRDRDRARRYPSRMAVFTGNP
jgi:hypothetical protein